MGDQHDKGGAGIRITAERGRWVMAWLCGVLIWVGGTSVWAQEELPSDDPAAWLVEASVQARRVSGVGEELTYALQTKGALLANIAAAQRDLGEDAAAQENETIVRLCLRALAHEGEDGWIHASQALQNWFNGRDDQVDPHLDNINNPTERAYVTMMIRGDGRGEFDGDRDQLGRGFREQLDRSSRYGWARETAGGIAQEGRLDEAQVWVGLLDDPAERAWASLGVARGLLEPAMTAESSAVTIVETAVVSEPEAEPQPEPEVLEDAQSVTRPASDPAVSAAEELAGSDEPVADLVQAPTTEIEPERAEIEPNPEPAVAAEPQETQAAVETEPQPEASPVEPATSEMPAEDSSTSAAISIDAQELASAIEEAPAVAVPIVVAPKFETSPELEPAVVTELESVEVSPEPKAVETEPTDLQPAIETPVADAPAPGVVVAPLVPDLSTLADPVAVLTTEVSPGVFDVEFTTTTGAFTVRVHREWAPLAADRFHDLAAAGFYHNQRFFRVVPGFVVQWGIHGFPDVAAAWRPQTLADEPRTQPNRRGTIAFAAATQPNTRATQVFINLTDNAFLDDLGFVPFGEVVEGMDVVESLFGGYGETPSSQQREIQLQGNTFLDARYPELDSIISAELSPAE
ncbi:MAG: peptidylprolyl isomerase [Planctomycetota bacterium]